MARLTSAVAASLERDSEPRLLSNVEFSDQRVGGLADDVASVFLREAAEIVYAHQEKFDGTGYPRGLKGEEIPLGARIFAIADALDAMTSDRPYRKGSSIGIARAEVACCSGTQFDPAIVQVFLNIPEAALLALRDQSTKPGFAAFRTL